MCGKRFVYVSLSNGLFRIVLLLMKGKHFVVSLSITFKRLNCKRCVYIYCFCDTVIVLEHLGGEAGYNEDKHG